jgi:general secretion pathway protein B
MSSILKALKKLEEEKARGREGSVDIARDILRGTSRRQTGPAWLLPALAAAVLLIAVAVAVVGLLRREPEALVAPLLASPERAPAPVATSPPPATDPPVQEVRLPPSPAAATGAQTAARRAASVVSAEPPTPAATAVSPAPASKPPTVSAAPAEPAAEAPAAASPPRPRLAVSAIAFQADREGRLAVVNDLPVMEGTAVEGMTVEEILPDRVRFSRQGQSFEVALGAE